MTFSPDAALAAIKDLFWREGFEGASLQEIERATGLNKQSLYRLYADKRGMYLAALDHYMATDVAASAALLAGPGPARDKFRALFHGVIDIAVAGDRRGCFLCNASADQAALDPESGARVAEAMETVRSAFEGALEDAPDRRARAGALLAAFFGLRIMVRAGAPEADLRATADAALALV